MRYALIFGKNWKLSLAEAISLLDVREPTWNFVDLCDGAMVIDTKLDPDETMKALGGTLKIVRIDKQFDLEDISKQNLEKEKEEKLSFYGNPNIGRQLKKVFPYLAMHQEYTATELIKHNMEENVLVWGLKTCYFGPTISVSDYRSFRKRDENRPLHPPLGISPSRARILVNLAQASESLLDPFCGYGTVVQEAMLSGVKKVCGSDVDKTAVTASHKNIEWAKKRYQSDSEYSIKQCDARKLETCWHGIEAIATEPELGPALATPPTKADAEKIMKVLQPLYESFIQSAFRALKPGGRIAIAFPMINSKKGKVFVDKYFTNIKMRDLFARVPVRYREYFGLRGCFVIDEEREPGKKRVVAREFCVIERRAR